MLGGGVGSEARFKGGAGRQVTGDLYARTLCRSKKISKIGTKSGPSRPTERQATVTPDETAPAPTKTTITIIIGPQVRLEAREQDSERKREERKTAVKGAAGRKEGRGRVGGA